MAADNKRKLQMATIVFWVLLAYIIAALIWWSVSLLQQNTDIYELKKAGLAPTSNLVQQLASIEAEQRRAVYKYIGEGCAFLLLILVGAGFLYRSVRRQFRLQQQQQNFAMAVTHELKTPIAISRLNLETLQKHQLAEDKKQKLLQATLQETARLDSLINNILISSQLEGNAYRATKEELNFSELVKDGLREFKSRYPKRALSAHISDELEVEGDPMLLKLLLSNLVENAHKYSPTDKAITVEAKRKAQTICLQVTDEGQGIPEEEKKAVFEKFYRMGNEQTRTAQGTGLGLYICRQIVREHNGTILLKDNTPAGSKFIVQFTAHD